MTISVKVKREPGGADFEARAAVVSRDSEGNTHAIGHPVTLEPGVETELLLHSGQEIRLYERDSSSS